MSVISNLLTTKCFFEEDLWEILWKRSNLNDEAMLGEKIEYHWNYVRDRPGLQSRLKYTILLFYSIQIGNIKNCFLILLYCTWIHVTFVVERISWLKIVFNRTIYNTNTMKSICQSRNKYLQDIKNFNYFRISFHLQKWLGVTKKYSHSSHKGWWSLSVLCCCVTNYHRPRNLKQPRVIVLVAQWWRICLPVQKTQVWSLGREDPLKKEMTTDSCFLAWLIPWTVELSTSGSGSSLRQC